MAPSVTFRQELPPPGGYKSIEWARKATGKPVSGLKILGIAIGIKAVAYIAWRRHLAKKRYERLEMNDSRVAVSPLYLAEQDREYMRQVREIRDWETELMKDVPDWKVGTLYGEPVYHNVRERFNMHADQWEINQAEDKFVEEDPIRKWFQRKWYWLTSSSEV